MDFSRPRRLEGKKRQQHHHHFSFGATARHPATRICIERKLNDTVFRFGGLTTVFSLLEALTRIEAL
jgi:hypothetical protein